MMRNSVCRRLKARLSEASHCAVGTEATAPRTISEMLAMIGRLSPNTAFIQSGIGMITPPISISKGKASSTMNRITSQGELRKSWVMNQATRRTAGFSDICASPSAAPAAVPMVIASTEISTFRKKPDRSRKGIQRHSASVASP